jgi:hypothetical protein
MMRPNKIEHVKRYDCLNSLLSHSQEAKEFFMKLPENVQGDLLSQARNITSMQQMKDQAMDHFGNLF